MSLTTTTHRRRRARRVALSMMSVAAGIAAPLLLAAAPAQAAEDFSGWSFHPTALCNHATGSVQVALLAQSNAGYSDYGPTDGTIAWMAWVRMNGGQWNVITGDQTENGWETANGRTIYTLGKDARWGHGTYEVYVSYAISTPNGWQTSGEVAQHSETTGYQDNVFATGASCTA